MGKRTNIHHIYRVVTTTLLLIYFTGCFSQKKSSQDNMVGIHKNSKPWSVWRWKRESKNSTPYNPSLRNKTKQSTLDARENAKVIKSAKKTVRKEKRKLRRTKGAYKKGK